MKKIVFETNASGQKIINLSYQKILLPFLNLITSIITYKVSPKHPAFTSQKEINVTGEFQQAEIRGEVTVMLTDRFTDRLLLEGNPKDLDCVKATVKKGKLVINAEKKRTIDKMVVYVSIKNLTSLIINGDARVFSSGTIRTGELEILLKGISLIAVNYEGKVNITAGEGYEFAYNMN